MWLMIATPTCRPWGSSSAQGRRANGSLPSYRSISVPSSKSASSLVRIRSGSHTLLFTFLLHAFQSVLGLGKSEGDHEVAFIEAIKLEAQPRTRTKNSLNSFFMIMGLQ